jgi:hypothetical protein
MGNMQIKDGNSSITLSNTIRTNNNNDYNRNLTIWFSSIGAGILTRGITTYLSYQKPHVKPFGIGWGFIIGTTTLIIVNQQSPVITITEIKK